jgi:hypothetical protein
MTPFKETLKHWRRVVKERRITRLFLKDKPVEASRLCCKIEPDGTDPATWVGRASLIYRAKTGQLDQTLGPFGDLSNQRVVPGMKTPHVLNIIDSYCDDDTRLAFYTHWQKNDPATTGAAVHLVRLYAERAQVDAIMNLVMTHLAYIDVLSGRRVFVGHISRYLANKKLFDLLADIVVIVEKDSEKTAYIPKYLMTICKLLQVRKRPDLAHAILQKCVDRDALSLHHRVILAESELRVGHLDKALSDIEEIRAHPRSRDVLDKISMLEYEAMRDNGVPENLLAERLREAEGRRFEKNPHAVLFGASAKFIPFFLDEIDESLKCLTT